GGIYSIKNTVTISNSMLLGNKTENGDGAGAFFSGVIANISQSSIGYNYAAYGHGGGISSDSSNVTLVNTTVSNHMAGYNGGGIAVFGGGTLTVNYSTIANNSAGADSYLLNDGGGIYQSAGSLVLSNSILSQNWQISVTKGVVTSRSHNDYYSAMRYPLITSNYSIVGVTNCDSSFVGIHNYIYGNGDYSWGELMIDGTMAANGNNSLGNITLTVYVQGGSIACGHAKYDSAVTVDQRGRTRSTTAPTIGAYEKGEIVYYYYGTADDDPNNLSLWATVDGEHPNDFTAPEQTFSFDSKVAADVNLSVSWDVGRRCEVKVVSGSVNVIAGAITVEYMTVVSGGTLIVSGGAYSGSVTVEGVLVIAAADASVSNMTIASTTATSTVQYSYNGFQQMKVLSGGYGNLVIGGSGMKYYAGNLVVKGNLGFAGDDAVYLYSSNLTVNGAIISTASTSPAYIYAADITVGSIDYSTGYLSITGNSLTATGDVLLVGSMTVANDIVISGDAAVTGNMSGSSLQVGGDLALTDGTSSFTTTVQLGGNLLLNRAVLASGGNLSFNNSAAVVAVRGNGASSIRTGGLIYTAGVATGPAFDVGNGVGDMSSLTVEFTGDVDLALYDVSLPVGSWDWTYDVDLARVYAGSTLWFSTNGTVGSHVVNGAANISGTLGISANRLDPLEIDIANGSLILKSIEAIQLAGLTVNGSITFAGNVDLVENDTVVVTSKNGSVGFTGKLNGNGRSLLINGNTSVTLTDLSALTNLTVNSNDIRVGGTIVASGVVDFSADNVVTVNDNAVIAAQQLLAHDFMGSSGTESLTLNIADGFSTSSISNLGHLSLYGGNYAIDSITALQQLSNYAGLNVTAISVGSLYNAGNLAVTDVAVFTGNINNVAGATMVVNDLFVSGTAWQSITSPGYFQVDNLNVMNGNGVEVAGGNIRVDNIAWATDAGNVVLSGGNLYLTNDPLVRPNYQYFETTGTGMLYRQVGTGSDTSYLVGTATGYADVLLQAGSGNGWIGIRATDGVAAHNVYAPKNNIRGLEDTIKLTFTADASQFAGTFAADFGNEISSTVLGSNFDPDDYSLYQYTNAWNKTTWLSSGDFIFANSTGVEFRAEGVLDYPTEGWTIDNVDNTSDWYGEFGPGGYATPTQFLLTPADLSGFTITPAASRGFSLIGFGSDIGNSLDIMPQNGEYGVNPYAGGFQLLGDSTFEALDNDFGFRLDEEEMEIRDLEQELDYLGFEGIDQLMAKNDMFKSGYDAAMEDFLAC
ncbi:MAG: hypothetical protein PHQ27_00005, partial [Victivallales bacterium]|nr:hypothetical protein [Victivallales bacterium]